MISSNSTSRFSVIWHPQPSEKTVNDQVARRRIDIQIGGSQSKEQVTEGNQKEKRDEDLDSTKGATDREDEQDRVGHRKR